MREKEPQHLELTPAEGLVPELNRKGFVILEDNNSFLGRFGEFFTNKLKPAGQRIAIPVSVVLLAVAATACSQEKVIFNGVQIPNSPTVTLNSEIGKPEVARRSNPPVRVKDESDITFPARLQLPEGTRVVIGKCASDGKCLETNFYWAPTKEAVLLPKEREHKLMHELCHAHQHWSINGGNPLQEDDMDLESWYQTAEGRSFTNAVEGLSWPWTHSARNGIEDFAWTCGFFYFDPHYLQDTSPERYKWAVKNLP